MSGGREAARRAMRFLHVGAGEPYPTVAHAPGIAPLKDADRRGQGADCDLLALDETDTVLARCSCWWTQAPQFGGQRAGVIGHYAATDLEAGSAVLSRAAARLGAAGCARAVGPMDGNTWRRYRVVTDRGSEPPFFLEPWTPAGWLEHWAAAGFEPIAEFTSAMSADLAIVDPRVERASARLEAAGFVIRSLNASDPESDLARIFSLSLESFKRNFLFTAIAKEEFLARYRSLLPVVRPELVLLAERQGSGGALCGFLFAIPDVLQGHRGAPVETVIIKTVAVSPDDRVAGLGSVLVARAHELARALGYRRAIHALMADDNVSRNISRRYASTMRRYALLGKPLASQSSRRP
jgi:GNAT superfamily N-acetyltransferase